MSDTVVHTSATADASTRLPAAWLAEAKCGVMLHYLGPDRAAPPGAEIERWNALVDAFDVDRLVQTLTRIGAGYLIFTVGQNSGYYCAPNATYDRIVGLPSRLSRRDLMADIAGACHAGGIRFIAYSTFSAPANHPEAIARLGFAPDMPPEKEGGPLRLRKQPGNSKTDAQINWEAVHREWSLAWGKLCDGWWIDGARFSDGKVELDEVPDYQGYSDALKAGNPQSIVTFNPGVWVPVGSRTECDDYTAGEANTLLTHNSYHPVGRDYPGRVYHVLSFLGEFWGGTAPRFPDDLVIAYTRYVADRGGAVTWDMPIDIHGNIPQAFIEQATKICQAVRTSSR